MMNADTKQTKRSVSHMELNRLDRLTYLLVGAGIGAAAALLFAPKPGAAFREDIADATKKRYDETLELAQRVKEQTADVYHSLREKTDKVYDLAAARFSFAKTVTDGQAETADSKINGAARYPAEREQAQKPSNAGRRASSIM